MVAIVLRLRVDAPDWNQAKCLGKVSGPHPEDPKELPDYDPWSYAEDVALEFCNSTPVCPIREQCLMFALTNNCSTGVWGGMTEVDRKALRKRWPLERGEKVNGKATWKPREEWAWMEPGEASEGLDRQMLLQELLEEMSE